MGEESWHGFFKQESASVPTPLWSMENLMDGFGFIISISSLLPTRSHDLDILSLPFVGKEMVESTQITRLMLNNFFFPRKSCRL
jgi:hypothetical protein